ncbi:MAG: sulfur oxidation c-type cytochrome SoxX [Alphaproteobacteria bacterium]|nr:sulfur oxidation c-type cytochrome SoxX [Alphaproteobacteria bacterium]
MRKIFISIAAVLIAGTAVSTAQQKPAVDRAKADAAVKSAFPSAPADWQPRLVQDETMKQCSAHDNLPPKAVGEAIQKRERATIEYPADGQFMGDWKRGERIAQSGYGLRFTDYPPRNPNGGNCYACHQLTKAELSFGTVGPSLLNYGGIRKFGAAETKAVYEKIYNAHASYPCSLMPRLGSNKVLTIEQIKDVVALVMSPDSPVNK